MIRKVLVKRTRTPYYLKLIMGEVSTTLINKNKGGKRKGKEYNKNIFPTKPMRVIAALEKKIRQLEADYIHNARGDKDISSID